MHLREREAAATQYCLSQPPNTLLMAAARGSPRSRNGLAERGREEGAPSEEGSGVDPVPTPPCPPPAVGAAAAGGEEGAGRLQLPRRPARPRRRRAAMEEAATGRVVRTGAGRLGVDPAPAAPSSHESDASRRAAAIRCTGGGATAAGGGGGGGESAGASSSRASAAAGGTGVEVVGDVANRTDKPAIGATRIECAD